MNNSRYAFAGFAAIIIAGGLFAYYSQTAQKPQPQPQAPVQNTEPAADKPAQGAAQTAIKTKNEAQPPAGQQPAPANTGQEPAGAQQEPAGTQQEPAGAQKAEVTVPVFDVLRLEGDGSLVVAGKASPGAEVDVISKTRVLGSAKAGENGDFAIVLDQVLKAGDYQLVLRATGEDNSVATSQQTAILSVPEKPDGQLLALVEEPGQASRMITLPHAAKAGAMSHTAKAGTMPDAAKADTMPQDKEPQADNNGNAAAVLPPASAQGGATSAHVQDNVSIAVEAVEIEGNKVFVAGHARGGQSVNVYANETQLGASLVTAEGRYLVQSQQPLAVGDYIIRAELLGEGGKVLATARVPFRREQGDNIAAVAPAIGGQAESQAGNSTEGEAAQPLEKADGSVIIRKGDNLWTISKRTYGSGLRYTTIYLANRDQIKNPDLIWPGQVFIMPKQPLSDQDVKQRLR